MKIGKYILAFLLLAGVASCAKDSVEELSREQVDASRALVLRATMPEQMSTRVALEDKGEAGVELTWEADDSFSVYDGFGNYVCDFKYLGAGAQTQGEFEQVVAAGEAAKELYGAYTAVYPAAEADGGVYPTLAQRDAESLSYGVQSGTDESALEHLKQSVRMRAEFSFYPLLPENGGQLNYVNIAFRNETALLSLSFTLPADRTPESLTLRVSENEKHELTMSEMTAATAAGANVFKTNVLVKADDNATERYFSYKLTLDDNSELYHSTKTSELSNAGGRYIDEIASFNNWIPVYDAEDLKAIKDYLQGFYFLENDIDLDNAEWTPIGTNDNRFSGALNGNNKTISNLSITSSGGDKGLFGSVEGCKISNLIIQNVSITNASSNNGALAGVVRTSTLRNIEIVDVEIECVDRSGGLCGYLHGSLVEDVKVINPSLNGTVGVLGGAIGFVKYSDYGTDEKETSTIRRVSVQAPKITAEGTFEETAAGELAGNSVHLGGIIGLAQGLWIEDCELEFGVGSEIKSASTIVGSHGVGGIVGTFIGYDETEVVESLKNCRTKNTDEDNAGINSQQSAVGGIVGTLQNANIVNCSNELKVTGSKSDVGGIAGNCLGTASIVACSNLAALSGLSNIGGIVGSAEGTLDLLASSNVGAVQPMSSPAGGLIGSVGAAASVEIISSYNDAKVDCILPTNVKCGGLIGELAADATFSFYNTYWVDNLIDDATAAIGAEDSEPSVYPIEALSSSADLKELTVKLNQGIILSKVAGLEFVQGAVRPELTVRGEIVY